MKRVLRILIAYSVTIALLCNQSITAVLANSDYPLEEIRSSYDEQKLLEPKETEEVGIKPETTEPVYAPEIEATPVPTEIIPTMRSIEETASTSNELIKTSNSQTVLEAIYDDQAPSKPMELKCESKTQTQVNLVWTASTDNIGVKGYGVYRNGNEIVSVGESVYTDNSVDKNKYYKYYVIAIDESGNKSEPSNEIEVNTFQSIDINSDMTLQADMEVGNLNLNSGNLNLNGHKLVVNGSLTQTNGNLTINKGELVVKENYTLANGASGLLVMTNPNDYISVCGNFHIQSYYSHNGQLTEGVLEVKGDFTQRRYSNGYTDNFKATGNHKV
ncbi:MAG: fibronectin type III domain-containing protein, partial [Clostridiaceae bacterium]|nr:fibronectin type III domain-containing protein [Clostridiaceae bacterium]